MVLQKPLNIGYLAAKQLLFYLIEEQIEKIIDMGIVVATRDNMENTEIKSLLEPGLAKYF